MPDWIVTLSHPDFNRRPRNYTGSADLFAMAKALAGFQPALRVPSRLAVMRNALNIADLPPVGISPRPENKRVNYNAIDYLHQRLYSV